MERDGFKTLHGQTVNAIGLGTMPISDFYPPFPPESQTRQLIRDAISLGVNLIDTAMVYGDGYSERVIGQAVAGQREHLFIVSKCGLYRKKGTYVLDGRPESLIQHCHDSLQRLQIDVLDALLIHRLDPSLPLADSLGALDELRRQGLVRYIGLSEVDGPTLKLAQAITQIDLVQNEYSFMSRDPETDGTFEQCREQHTQFMAYSPIGRGFFTQAAKSNRFSQLDCADIRTILPRYQSDNLPHNQAILHKLDRLAQQYHCTLPQLALAWILAQAKQVDVPIYPIPGTKRIEHIQENIAASHIELEPADVDAINQIVAPNAFQGERWPSSITSE